MNHTPSPKTAEEVAATKLAAELLAVFNGSADHGQINVATFLIKEAFKKQLAKAQPQKRSY